MCVCFGGGICFFSLTDPQLPWGVAKIMYFQIFGCVFFDKYGSLEEVLKTV